MNEIFDVVGRYREVYEMLTDPEVDEEVVTDTLEGLVGELEVHAAGIVPILDRLDMEIDACKKHKDEWAVAEKVRKNRKARFTDMKSSSGFSVEITSKSRLKHQRKRKKQSVNCITTKSHVKPPKWGQKGGL